MWTVHDGVVARTVIDPRDLGLSRPDPAALRGGDAAVNARIAHAVLDGHPGPVRDVVLLNAAAVLVAASASRVSLVEGLAAAMARCAEAVDSGAARATLARWVAAGRRAYAGA
ncbi:hypothetical protein K1W54_22950 [Micromonospora sp. CPCC 205371]|nr:hypothetical protein [Micromonospora sp. CPCC 205371]